MRAAEIAALVLLGVVLLIRYPLHFIGSTPYLMDLDVYRTVAERLMQGQADLLYAPTQSHSEMMVFKYAPVWALLWLPLAWLPADLGSILWTAADLCALLVTLVLCGRCCRQAGLRYLPVTGVLAVLVVTRAFGEEMGNGQVNLLWGALTAGFIHAAMRGRFWIAASALVGAILLKLPSLLFLPYLLLTRRWRLALTTGLLAFGAATASSIVLLPRAPWRLLTDWAAAVASGSVQAFEIGNQSVLALLSRYLTTDGYGLNLAGLSVPVITALAAGGLLLCVVLVSRPLAAEASPTRFLFDSAILTVAMAILSPTCWLATYTVLVFPVFIALAALQHRVMDHRWDPTELSLAALALLLSLLTHRKIWRLLGMMSWRGETYLFLVFMILPWLGLTLMAWLWRQRRMRPPSGPV